MKINLQTVIFIILILLVIILGFSVYYFWGEWKIYKQNQNNFMSDQAKELQLTKKELKKLFDEKTIMILDSMHIKTSQVDHYIQTITNYHDSIKTTVHTIYDTVKDNYNWLIEKKCYSISGYFNSKSKMMSASLDRFTDTTDIFQYHDWENKIFWGLIKWNRYDIAGAYSRCMNDTLGVIKNYKRRNK